MSRLGLRLNRHRGLRSLKSVLSLLAGYPLYLAGYLVPKQAHTWVFGNVLGYRDSARYLFEYVRRHHPDINAVWIYRRGDRLPDSCDGCYRLWSVPGLWYQYRARIAFLSTGMGDVARFTLARTRLVQCWHGIPIKRILLDSDESLPSGNSSSWINRLARRVLQHNLSRYSLVLASSDFIQERFSSAFGLPAEKIAVTGFPRHDIIMAHADEVRPRVLYAPTWRPDAAAALSIVQLVCNPGFVSALQQLGYELRVSIHPLNAGIEQPLREVLQDSVTFLVKQDINVEPARSEVLITDYSSVAIDFSLLGRRVIFFAPDLDDYMDARDTYPEFTDMIRQHRARDQRALLAAVSNRENTAILDAAACFMYHDTGSRARVVALVRQRFLLAGT